MSDPLSLVRNATLTGTAVNYVDNYYHFGAVKLHESTKTAFKRTLKSNESVVVLVFCSYSCTVTVVEII